MHPFALAPPDLTAALAELLRTVPVGRAAAFGDLAAALGAKSAAVWVGTVCRRPPAGWAEDEVPTWRAVRATGGCVTPGQADRLRAEGAPVEDDRVDLNACRFDALPTRGPLHALADRQDELAGRVRIENEPIDGPVAAVDVAYPSPGVARAAYVEMTPDGDDPAFELAVESPAPFPYVSGFLSYRELPAYAALVDRLCDAGREPGLILVDGNGVLHPRRCGVACGLGVLADVPTVGVAKKKLCGSVAADGTITLDGPTPDGEVVGARVANPHTGRIEGRAKGHAANPVFVSPGHRVGVAAAVRAATDAFRTHRLPEPLFLADRLSKTG